MKDEDIYFLIKSGKEEGLSLLMDKYGGLLAYITKKRGDFSEEDTAECVSDILFTIWKRIGKFDETRSSFKTWVIMVARGCAIDYLRKNNRHKKVASLHDMEELSIDNKEFDTLSYERLIGLLQELPPPDNRIFYRRFILGESPSEIARRLNLTVDGIYKRIMRGKEKLKKLMNREGYGDV